ncbi:MAG: hypothetical protein ACFFBD_24260 [Candidatus Hodarchaeota archaeon]
MTTIKRLGLAILVGAFLGIFCIIGVGSRVGFTGNELFLFAMWYNRVVMGLLIGVAGDLDLLKGSERKWVNVVIRGFLLGLVVSSAIFFSTEFRDLVALFAGIIYGVIIDLVATKFGD